MRFLPYILVAAMAAPILVWLLVDALVIKGTATAFAGMDLYVVLSLGLFTVLAFTLLATWMDKLIQRTR